MNDPITCPGNELQGVLDGLRRKGFHPWAMDCLVGRNSGYRVSYFQTFPTKPQDASSGASQSGRDSTRPVKGAQVAGHNAQHQTAAAGSDLGPEKAESVTDAPASISDRPGCVETADLGSRDDLSIEDRLSAIQQRLRAEGRLKSSPPKPSHARMPYVD